ncbi:hypothetical protein GOV04_03165 [Candidatus Woesearchaeota archaeon]|nr:hypothetical protein [Candidatus Woesearchaeota archaeon]
MKSLIRKDILQLLKDLKIALAHQDFRRIKELSDHTLHNSSIFQDEDSISVGVIVYALAKLLERYPNINLHLINGEVNQAIKKLEHQDSRGFLKTLKSLFTIIKKIDSKTTMYIQHVLEQSGIKKGSRIYEHGISLAQTATVLDVNQWELMNYVGKTSFIEREKDTGLLARLKLARKIFRKS